MFLVHDVLEVDKRGTTTKKLQELPKFDLMISQKNGVPVKIPIKEVTCSEKILGVYSCPTGEFGCHLDKLEKKGILWGDTLKVRLIPLRDAWLGYRHALYC